MAEAVEEALAHERPLLVEAGTGTGKTFAYLIAAILSGKKVVIATATRALQEQIFLKDIPLVRKVLAGSGIAFNAALMKGLSNYLCRRRFEEWRASGTGEERWVGKIEQWARETESGDRSEIEEMSESSPVWREVQSSTETRIGADCKYFEECFVTKMRRDAERATIVVVNHHLFLADLAMRSSRSGEYASALPNYDAVIFDEAHQIEDIATEFFGVRVSTARVEALVRDVRKSAVASASAAGGRPAVELVEEAAQRLFLAISSSSGAAGYGESKRVASSGDWSDDASAEYATFDLALKVLHASAIEKTKDEVASLLGRRLSELRSDFSEIVAGLKRLGGERSGADANDHSNDDDDDDPLDLGTRVTWIDVRDRSVAVGSSPVHVGPTLRRHLFSRIPTVICTSATLATSSSHSGLAPSFHFIKSRLGAPPDIAELVVDSPFDFANCSALYVARDLPEPSDSAFQVASADRIIELIGASGGGAFVLCTSNRSMRAISQRIAHRVKSPVFTQGEAPKHLLLSRFRASGNAVLVATMSFWEGVDVPGNALRLVILEKIPFAVPTDPVTQARCHELERNGGNPFVQYSVPAAALTLKQGFGRLLRTQSDRGVVAILDRRLVTKPYGRRLIEALPLARRIATVDEVRRFFCLNSSELG